MGGLEILYDLTNDVDYKYVNQGKHMYIKTLFLNIFKEKFKVLFWF